MKMTIISHWYNEELLAPLFLSHYKYADEIHILLETDTNDNTRKILEQQSNVIIEDIHNPSGNDEREMRENINNAISQVKEGWIYMVDADEFIFPENFEDPQIFLGRQKADVIYSTLFHVYRHFTERDIDYEKEVIPQRVHALEGKKNDFNNQFIKPNVFRAACNYRFAIGIHTFEGEHTISNERYIGAHWKLADLEIAVRRRLSNKERLSARNRRKGYCNHEFHITKERIEQSLAKNSMLPVLPFLVSDKELL